MFAKAEARLLKNCTATLQTRSPEPKRQEMFREKTLLVLLNTSNAA
jgi:hypothetical protein